MMTVSDAAPCTVEPAVSADWVVDQMRLGHELLLLDCRPSPDYNTLHVDGAIPVAIPSLMLKRLKKGNLSVGAAIKCQRFHSKWRTERVVLYDDASADLPGLSPNCILALLFRRLGEEGCRVHYLNGGFSAFQTAHPALCVGAQEPGDDPSILGLCNLQINDSQDSQDPGDDPDNHPPSPDNHSSPFPVEVLPNLYLGNAGNSADLECLYQNGIKYVLNVTPDIPNTFAHDAAFRYMQIPINDHWSQNLAQYFPDAIAFIDEARQKKCGVLVHCLAGISRSVTVTVAYLMYKGHMSLNDAYDVVKKCKPNISPNFNFMGQLLDFERTLRNRCTCSEGGASRAAAAHPGNESQYAAGDELRICNCKKETKTFFSSPTCTSSSVSSTSSVSSSSSLAMSSASSNTAFDYDISPTPS